ncbi:sensor histidine kinase [Mucilaginibacter celer]|uniref:histidine kinase n=1 Tax=Mucilaginibacter celer TaxID=2305508 RepID=A0A494VJV4_9SPHI|nr:sensor histidine kinase [Mucilaginibacter celer]AYL95367.1 hypothetical protein HYN43_008700 [Mucilaginibacter celer]
MICTIKTSGNNRILYSCVTAVPFLIFFILCPFITRAQYYGFPRPVPANRGAELLTGLKKSKADSDRVNILLDLSNLYYNKQQRKDADLNTATRYADQARQLSAKINYRPGFGKAQVRMAEILSDKGKVTEAEHLLPTVTDTTRINLLLALSYKSFYAADDITDNYYKNALKYAEQARDSSKSLHQKVKEIIARTILTHYRHYGNYPGIEKDYNDIINECNQVHYPYLEYIYLPMYIFYMDNGLYEKGFELAQKSFELEKKNKDPLALADCYSALSRFYANAKQQQKSIDFLKLAITQMKIHPSMFGNKIPETVTVISSMLRYKKRDREALAFLQKSIREFPADDAAEAARYEQELGRCYQKIDNSQAEKYLLKSYNYLFKKKQAFQNDHFEMAQFYVETRSYAKAKPYLDRIFKTVKQKLPLSRRSNLEYLAYKVDSAAGNYRSALTHLSKNKALDNLYLTEKREHDMQDFDVKYETKKKEDQIKMLNQKAALEKGDMQRLTLVKNVTIGGILLTLFIAFLLYRQSAQRKKNNQVISQKNDLLQHLLTEKEWLLKEVHHRVKNNLHTVICLLESQAVYLENDALKAIENSQHRIYAMSLIHQKLYQSEDIKTIDMGIYLPEFIGYLKDSFGTGSQILFELNIEPIKLGVSYAVPLSLIINEAVTNALKYAFPDNRAGKITVYMYRTGLIIRLIIADNGVGISPAKIESPSNSLGLKLLRGLTEDIQGTIGITNDNGTRILIEFEIDTVMNSLAS